MERRLGRGEDKLRLRILEEKLEKVRKALQQLKQSRKIRDFLGTRQFSFARMKTGIDFYVVYIDGAKYVGRSLSVLRTPEMGQNKNSIRVSLFDSQNSIQRKILEAIKRL